MKTLLKLQIGPVQDFIAQARSTRDLWSGSYLLSWLMAAGAKALVQAAGRDEGVVISPTLTGQPIYDFHLDQKQAKLKYHNDEILTPNFTNILIAELPIDFAEAATEAMVKAIGAERDAIAKACWEKLHATGLAASAEQARFFAQVKRFPTITWQLTGPPTANQREKWLKPTPLATQLQTKLLAAVEDFPAQITRNSWELDAVRALRDFEGWDSESGVHEKDSLTGREEAVIGGNDWWEFQFEEVIGAQHKRVVRLKERNGLERPSELWPILFRQRQKGDWFGALQLVKRLWHWAYLAERPWQLRSTQKREPLGKEFPFPSTAHIAIHDPAKNIREYLEDPMQSASEEEVEKKLAHIPYFAVLAMDGDHMGAWLGGENNDDGPTKEFRGRLSRSLSNFALHCVRPIVEACDGRLILAGGEDVLALLPADTAVDCAEFLRLAYRGDAGFIAPLSALAERLRQHHLNHGYVEPPHVNEQKPEMSAFLVAAARRTLFAATKQAGSLLFNSSLASANSPDFAAVEELLTLPGGIERSSGVKVPDVSCGIAIAHFKEPLQDVVQAALAAEKRAKNDLDRGALAVTLVKHSGETVKWGAKWEFGGLQLLDLIQRGRGEGVFSSRLPHRIVETLSPYLLARDSNEAARLEKVAEFQESVDDIIAREFAHVLDRQKGDAPAASRNAFLSANGTNPLGHLRSFLGQLSNANAGAQEKLHAVIGLCQVAAFVEPAVYSSTFITGSYPTAVVT